MSSKYDSPFNQIIGNKSLSTFDVIVIGAGAGGCAATDILTRNGQKVLVLEAGSNYFLGLDDSTQTPSTVFSNDEIKLSRRRFIQPLSNVEPRTFRPDESSVRTFVGDVNPLPKTVGGAGAHADLKMPRFNPTDFHLGSLLGPISGASFADWPVDYDMLEPFYYYTERLMGVQGVSGLNPLEGRRSGPFPMKPGVPMLCGLLMSEGAKKLGYHPFPYATSVNSQPYDGRPACIDCGACSGYVCPISAKSSPPVTALRKALLTGNCQLRPETRVSRLLMNSSKTEITGIEAIDPNGNKVTFVADRYVIAASPIENARLLYISDPDGHGIGNSSGYLGRNLTFHFQSVAVGIFEERIHTHRGRSVTHGFADFRGVPGDPNRPMGGIIEIGGAFEPVFEALTYLNDMGISGSMLKGLMRQSPFRDHLTVLTMQAEDAPQLTNRIDLDPEVKDLDGLPVARVTYKNHDFELSARKFYTPKMLDVLGASGAKWSFIVPPDPISTSAHVMGTLRFGTDPKTSVCDPNGKFHDLGNLFAADGSLFPTSSGFNPTLTICALSARVGAAMINPNSPESAIS